MKKDELYIGLMSGTSLDGIDVALVNFCNNTPKLILSHQQPIPIDLRQKTLELCYPGENAIHRMGVLDVEIGRLFAESVSALLEKTHYSEKDIQAIGSHGQTIRHTPNADIPFTLQIGDPNIIVAKTGITTVADFRRRDMALGGQAAPLAPAFHRFLFPKRGENMGVLNIGGIANLTFLPADNSAPIIGFDTGPGNTLLDAWCFEHTGKQYDKNGQWAFSGRCNEVLLKQWLADPYFQKSPPKSTGREYFHLDWLKKNYSIVNISLSANDMQATLLELTACSIADAVKDFQITTLWLCGGGAQNTALLQRLHALCQCSIQTTEAIGLHPDWVEAAAFAWLARQTLLGKPGNIPSVTGASEASILGAIYRK